METTTITTKNSNKLNGNYTNNYYLDIGLDISTTATGCCVLYPDGSVERIEAVVFDKNKDIWEKANEMKNWFSNLEKDCLFIIKGQPKIKRVFVEENMKSFQSGKSSADVLFTLAKFNGIVSYLAKQAFSGSEIIDINVARARKTLGVKVTRNSPLSAKQQTFDQIINNNLKDYTFPTKEINRGKNKGKIEYQSWCKDAVDAYVLGRAGQLLWTT